MTTNSDDKEKWNSHFRAISVNPSVSARDSSQILTENAHLLPRSGCVLDLACGLGANALFLAKLGFETHAWDISEEAIDQLQKVVDSQSLNICMEVRDVIARPPSKNSFDVIVVSRFLNRSLIPSLIEALKPSGLIFYQTFSVDKLSGIGPSNPDYLLKPNELLQMFRSLRIRVYREEGLAGNLEKGFRNEVMLVAQKPV